MKFNCVKYFNNWQTIWWTNRAFSMEHSYCFIILLLLYHTVCMSMMISIPFFVCSGTSYDTHVLRLENRLEMWLRHVRCWWWPAPPIRCQQRRCRIWKILLKVINLDISSSIIVLLTFKYRTSAPKNSLQLNII